MKKLLLLVSCLLLTLLIAITGLLLFPRYSIFIFVRTLEHHYGITISYAAERISLLKEWHVREVTVMQKSGFAFHAEELWVYPSFDSLAKGTVALRCRAERVGFSETLPLFGELAAALSLASLERAAIDTLLVQAVLRRNAVRIETLDASGKDIRLSGNGIVDATSHTMDFRLRASVAEHLTETIPESARNSLLKRQDEGWMGFDMRAHGDYRRPALRFETDSLQLNLKGVEIR